MYQLILLLTNNFILNSALKFKNVVINSYLINHIQILFFILYVYNKFIYV